MRLRVGLMMLGLAALSGCATMSESECRTADWRTVGFHDGEAGYARERIADHQESCAKAGVLPNAKAYFDGYAIGLRNYCTYDNATKVGLAGQSYRDVCPPELAPAFLSRYREAYSVYQQRSRIDALEGRRRDLEKKLEKAGKDDERHKLREQLRSLDHETRHERERLGDMERWLFSH